MIPVHCAPTRLAAPNTLKPNRANPHRTARDALRFLHDYLGWTGSKRPVALGLFGPLHDGFRSYRRVAG